MHFYIVKLTKNAEICKNMQNKPKPKNMHLYAFIICVFLIAIVTKCVYFQSYFIVTKYTKYANAYFNFV